MADRRRIGDAEGSTVLSLLEPSEDAFAQEAIRELGFTPVVVRTMRELEQLLPEHRILLIGDRESQADRVSTVRRARRRDEPPLVAAIADDLPMTVDLLEAGAMAVGSIAEGPRSFARRIAA